MKDPTKPPDPSKGDVVHTVIKAGLSSIPVIGGAATEIFSALITPPLARRRDEWIQSIAQSLKNLEEKVAGFKIENLSQNDSFITTVLHASQTAILNHQKEKLDALRNAVLNSALGNSLNDDLQLMFLNFVEQLTPWHIRLLNFFDNPIDWTTKHSVPIPNLSACGMGTIIETVFPELKGRRDFYDQLGKDLYARGLITGSNFHVTGTFNGIFQRSTTEMGQNFIRFISSPLE